MGSTNIEQPSTPAAPTTAESIQAWVDALPQIYIDSLLLLSIVIVG